MLLLLFLDVELFLLSLFGLLVFIIVHTRYVCFCLVIVCLCWPLVYTFD
jgi:hypothetical protein